MKPSYRDPDAPANSAEHHTGKPCVEGCGRPAGTAWSPYWCQPCNAARLDRIEGSLEDARRRLAGAMEAPSPESPEEP